MKQQEFIEVIQELVDKNKDGDIFRLGQITNARATSARIKLDGENTSTTKYYPTLASYVPVYNDRVVLVKIKMSYLIIGTLDGSGTAGPVGPAGRNGTDGKDGARGPMGPPGSDAEMKGGELHGTLFFNNNPITRIAEVGWCGIQTDSATPIGIGYAVNFRMTKSYTPSSISLSRESGNIANAKIFTGYINVHGFWFQFLRVDVGTNAAWRGYYTA